MTEELKSNAKENLPIRQNLVDTAVSFLLNPNVKQRPDDAKIAFLKNKGLTDSEIAEAFNRAKYEAGTSVVSNEDNQLVNAYPLPPYQAPNSFWFHLRSYSSAFVSFAVAVYVLHRFYKSYIEPWIFGSKSQQSEISALKEQLAELNNSVTRLTSTVSSLEEAVNNQIHLIDRTSVHGVESFPKSVRELHDEVLNVKSLLLNRFSFPAPPTFVSSENKTQNGESKPPAKVATIPKWQLRGSENGKSKENEGGEKSSSELSSLENGLSSAEDQTRDQENNIKMAKDKVHDADSKTDSENNVVSLEDGSGNSRECLENKLISKGKVQDEDSKIAMENHIRNIDEKTLDDNSAVESHNHILNSDSSDQTNERSVSTKNSE